MPSEGAGLDPDASAADLAGLASAHPELWDEIEAHANAYEELREWIRAARVQAPAMAEEPQAPAPAKPRIGLVLAILGTFALAAAVIVGVIVHKTHRAADEFRAALDSPMPTYSPSPTPEYTSEPTPTATAASFPAYTMSHSQTWNYKDPDGYSFTAAFAFGPPLTGDAMSGAEHPEHSGFALGSACSFDPATDAVIAGTLRVTSTTKSFATPVAVRFTVTTLDNSTDYNFSNAPEVEVESQYSDGPSCDDLSGYDGVGVSWPTPFEPDHSGEHSFFVILKNYLTPATPKGDAAWLRLVGIQPQVDTWDEGTTAHAFEPNIDATEGITLSGRTIHAEVN